MFDPTSYVIGRKKGVKMADNGSVLYSAAQTLTDEQKGRARLNIDAASDTDLKAGSYETRDLHLGFYLDDQGFLCQG